MAVPVTIAVRRQVIEVQVRGAESDGLLVQRHLSGTVEGVVARALERALTGVVPEDDHLVVDRLDIEVDDVSYAALDYTLAEAVRRDVEAYFRHHVPPPAGRTDRSADDPVTTAGAAIVRRSSAATVEEAFLAFLRDGRLPWSFRPAGDDLERAVADAWAGADATAGAGRWEALGHALKAPVVRLRVVKQFSAPFVRDLVDRVAPRVAGPLAEASGPWAATGPDGPGGSAFLRQVHLAALAAVAERRTVTGEELVRQALAALPEQLRADRELVEHLGRRWPRVSLDVAPPLASDRPHPARAAAGRSDPGADHGRMPAEATRDAASLLVDHAGLVLLHPFLPRFLEGLGVAAGEELLEADRAVALLHHLATGDEVVPEQATPLAKVLCGCPLGEPVERDPRLTTDEVTEATALLRAVIGHWEALRSTSPEALRREFLTRPGTLSTQGGDWVLRVEDRSVDILLEQLPWGISMVRTPWMERMLRVEWRA